jgi:hypothetical protein
MGHHITSNEMVNKHFEELLEKQSQACREQESLATPVAQEEEDKLMNVADADQPIIIPMTARESSVNNAGNAGTVNTETITTNKGEWRLFLPLL